MDRLLSALILVVSFATIFAIHCPQNVGHQKIIYDKSCSEGQSLGCMAGGDHLNCRFCWAVPEKCQGDLYQSKGLLSGKAGQIAADYTCSDIGTQKVVYDSRCSTGEAATGCNAGGEGENCRFCANIPEGCPLTTPTPTPTTTPFPTNAPGTCRDIGGQPVTYDPSCSWGQNLGCDAGGQDLNCRFCWVYPNGICRSFLSTLTPPPQPVTTAGETTESDIPVTQPPVPTTTTWVPTTQHPSTDQPVTMKATTTESADRCTTDPLSQTACTTAEYSNCACSDNQYCCIEGDAKKGCSTTPWSKPACSCACKMEPMPVGDCSFWEYLFSPCRQTIAPYYCPSSNGCASGKYRCTDLCYLTTNPPYPPRPIDGTKYTPSDNLVTQDLVCGAQTVAVTPVCDIQPNSDDWHYKAERQGKCGENGWYCPTRSADWEPSKYGCGPSIKGDTGKCDIAELQGEDCAQLKPYVAPQWAPKANSLTGFCQLNQTCNCDIIKDPAHCVGCCIWDNPNLQCKNFTDFGMGAACDQVSPRFNWIITTCDSQGALEFGGACQNNPFSVVDIYYVATYQLLKNDQGQFVWQLIPDSSVNWKGENKYVDWSSLPTEKTVPDGGGVVQSCSGGGGGWNAAYFPYKVDGATPPAMMFVLSYEKFENAAFFMLNQRILDGGPSTSTCKDMTNCWGEISAGEIDFLETPNLFPNRFQNEDGFNIYRFTSYNAANRCFACNHATHNGTYNIAGCGGQPAKTWYNANAEAGAPKPHVWAAIVDARGSTLYKDPNWPGLTNNCAAETLVNVHPHKPDKVTQPCEDPSQSCAEFVPGCVTDPTPEMVQMTGSDYSRIPQCYIKDWAVHTTCTENWWDLMVDSGQWMVNDPPVCQECL